MRPLQADDWDALYAVARDPLLWEQHPVHDRWREDVFRTFFEDALAAGGALVAVHRPSGAIAGSSQFRPCPLDPREIEIGWTFLARTHWGTGMNREIKRLMIGHALARFPRVLFRIGEGNLRSRKAIERVGGRLVEGWVEDGAYQGRPVRHVVYEITRDDFTGGALA
nr:GNAT family N-acetyltransferase [Tsuneonella aeria]